MMSAARQQIDEEDMTARAQQRQAFARRVDARALARKIYLMRATLRA